MEGLFSSVVRKYLSHNDGTQSVSPSETVSTSAPTTNISTSNGRTVTENFETTLHGFARSMATAASCALKTPKEPYDDVVAVILYWETPAAGLDKLVEKAKELGDLFKETFKFDVKMLPIPRDDLRPARIISAIEDELHKVRKNPNSLFILYYGGHASWAYNDPGKRIWKAESGDRSPVFEWSAAMVHLFTETVVCRKVFIFDCCHSGAMINSDHPWRGRTEILAACAPEIEASALEGSLFTAAIFAIFEKETRSIYQAHAMLCSSEMWKKYGLQKSPWYADYGDRESHSTIITKVGTLAESGATATRNKLEEFRERTIKLQELESISDAMILVAVTFKGTAEGFMDQLGSFERDWRGWFGAAPSHIDEIAIKACTLAKFHGVFDSNSCTTIWSIPVWLWDAMAPSDNTRYLGVVRSDNRATTLNDTPFLAASNEAPLLKNAPPVSSASKTHSEDPRIDQVSKGPEQPLSLPSDEKAQESESSPPGSPRLRKVESGSKKGKARLPQPALLPPPGKTPEPEPSRPESPKLREVDNDRKKAAGRFPFRRKKPILPESTAVSKPSMGSSQVKPHPAVPSWPPSFPKNASLREVVQTMNRQPEPSLHLVMQDPRLKPEALEMERRPTSKYAQTYLKMLNHPEEGPSRVHPFLFSSSSDYPREATVMTHARGSVEVGV